MSRDGNIKMQVKSFKANLVCHLTICPNLHIYILVDNLLKKCDMEIVTPCLTGMVHLTGITFTSLFYEILLRKVRHEKCDPLFGT